MNKNAIIENLYAVFSQYTTAGMHHCDCGCIDSEDVLKLASKLLRDLEEDDFVSYHGSALYTWGDLSHYKHYLPRILEVYNQLQSDAMIGLYELTYKLAYAKWLDWEAKEIQAIRDFMYIDWLEFVNTRASDVRNDELVYYSFFFNLSDLLNAWQLINNPVGLKNFVLLFYYCGNELLNKGLKIDGTVHLQLFKDFINQDGLIPQLEAHFFEVDAIDSEYAYKVSAVTQMIEQERKVG